MTIDHEISGTTETQISMKFGTKFPLNSQALTKKRFWKYHLGFVILIPKKSFTLF